MHTVSRINSTTTYFKPGRSKKNHLDAKKSGPCSGPELTRAGQPSVLREKASLARLWLADDCLACGVWNPSKSSITPRLAEVIKSRDSLRLVEGDWQSITFERDTAGLLQAYGRRPDRQFTDVPHATFANLESLPLAVRQSRSGQQFYFYLANASPWRLRVRLQLTEDVLEQNLNSIKSFSQAEFDFESYDADAKVLTVDLAPYDLIGGWASTVVPIESYSFEYLDDVASDLRKRMFALQVKLQQAQQAGALRILSNPKFLANESNQGQIQGWEIGQQPPSRFRLRSDSGNQKTGSKQQVTQQVSKPAGDELDAITTYLQIRSSTDGVTWIRSQPIAPTETGRLSISVWLRVLSTDEGNDKVPQVRMAIDGQSLWDNYYRFGVVGDKPVSDEPLVVNQ